MRSRLIVAALMFGTVAVAQNPTAVIDTSAGEMRCELFQDKVPAAVAHFVGLAEGTKDWTDPKTKKLRHGAPLYNGTVFHRVVPGFMIQGGDPSGTGEGEIGVVLNDEFVADLKFDRPGRLAYANSGPNTNSSQFFITEKPEPDLDACLSRSGCSRGGRKVPEGYGFTIFGQCDKGSVDLVKQIAAGGRELGTDRPIRPVVIRKIRIERGK